KYQSLAKYRPIGDGFLQLSDSTWSTSQADPRPSLSLIMWSASQLESASTASAVSSIVEEIPGAPPHPPSWFCAWHNHVMPRAASGDLHSPWAWYAPRTLAVP